MRLARLLGEPVRLTSSLESLGSVGIGLCEPRDIGSDIGEKGPLDREALSRYMRTPGVEPGPLAGQDPKSCASAGSATFAWLEDNVASHDPRPGPASWG